MQSTAAGAQVTPAQLADELQHLWVEVTCTWKGRMLAGMEELDLSLTQFKMLLALRDCPEEISIKTLSEQMGLSLPGTSRGIDGLLRRGFVERREDELDRRMKRIRLAPAGRDVIDQMETARLDGLTSWAEQLSDTQRERFHAALLALPHHQEDRSE